MYHEAATAGDDGTIEFTPRRQAELTTFANGWMKNIKFQQFATPVKQADNGEA